MHLSSASEIKNKDAVKHSQPLEVRKPLPTHDEYGHYKATPANSFFAHSGWWGAGVHGSLRNGCAWPPGMGSTHIGLIFSFIPVILQDDALFTQDRLQSPASANDELPSLRGSFQGLSEYRTKTSNPPAFIWGGGGRLTRSSTAMDTVS